MQVEDRNGLATLAANLSFLGLPTPGGVGKSAKRKDEVMFDDLFVTLIVQLNIRRGRGATETADQRLFDRIPGGFCATGWTGEFTLRNGFAHNTPRGESALGEFVERAREVHSAASGAERRSKRGRDETGKPAFSSVIVHSSNKNSLGIGRHRSLPPDLSAKAR